MSDRVALRHTPAQRQTSKRKQAQVRLKHQQHSVDSVGHLTLSDQETQAGNSVIATAVRLHPLAHPPVFLHCGWRTRGTWVWDRFRRMHGVACYYEPLNETLASVRSDTLASINSESWSSGHRGLDRPYFDEFRPLLKHNGPGVEGYHTRFAADDFFAEPNTALPELDHYLRRLIRAAQERGEQPVLKLCRSVGRIGWMQRHFPEAVHIVVLRNPRAQFASALRQFVLYGNTYFLAMPLLLLAMHRDLPAVGACIRHLGTELPSLPESHSLRARLAACEATVRCSSPAAWYRDFLACWVLTAATTPVTVDLIINSDLLERSNRYRRQCEIELTTLTGQTVDFGDADCSDSTRRPDVMCLRRSEILDAHRGAETFLAEQVEAGWADRRGLRDVAMMLTETVRQASCLEGSVLPDVERDIELMLSAMGRAAWAERELGVVERELGVVERELTATHASLSWRITAPLRWLRRQLRKACALKPIHWVSDRLAAKARHDATTGRG